MRRTSRGATIVGAFQLVLATALVANCGASKEPTPPAAAGSPAATDAPRVRLADSAPPAATADPMKDAAAWKALPAADRALRATQFVASIDASDFSGAERGAEFLRERGETTALAALGRKVLEKNPAAVWAHRAAGDVDLAHEVDDAIHGKENCEDALEPCWVDLKEQRAKTGAPWWADAAAAAKVREQIAQVEAAEKRLASPYEQAITHWVRWQRAIRIMQDHPALHGARGPHLVFVSLSAPKDAKLADVPAAEVAKGTKILNRNLTLYETFYDGWMRELGPIFGFTRYGPDNTDQQTLLKINVFTKQEDYDAFNTKSESGVGGFARAYYMPEEPRFITTYDGGEDEPIAYNDHVKCHEGVHQLVHLYSWDLSRKALGREPTWLDCEVRPTWFEEGFAEFFSSFEVKDGKYRWMQPLEGRMSELFVLGAIVAKKGWLNWELKEFLSIRDSSQLSQASAVRARTPADHSLAEGVMGSLYYGKAWSFVYFLWYAEDKGAPKYRAKFIDFIKRMFVIQYRFNDVKKHEEPVQVGIKEFRTIMGLESDAALLAVQKEWQAWEKKFVDEHHKPEWDKERDEAFKKLGLDKGK